MKLIEKAIFPSRETPQWRINDHTSRCSRLGCLSSAIVLVLSVLMCLQLFRNLWQPVSEIKLTTDYFESASQLVDDSELAVISDIPLPNISCSISALKQAIPMVNCSSYVATYVAEWFPYRYCYRVPRISYNDSYYLSIDIPEDAFYKLLVESVHWNNHTAQTKYLELYNTGQLCQKFNLDLLRVDLDNSLLQINPVSTKCGFSYESDLIPTQCDSVVRGVEVGSSLKVERYLYQRRKLTEIFGKFMSCIIIFRIIFRGVLGDINQNKLKADLAMEIFDEPRIPFAISKSGRLRLWLYSFIPDKMQKSLAKRNILVNEYYCTAILKQVEQKMSLDRILRDISYIQSSLSIKGDTIPSIVDCSFEYKLINPLFKRNVPPKCAVAPEYPPKSPYSVLLMFDICPLDIQLQRQLLKSTTTISQILYILCIVLLVGVFVFMGVVYKSPSQDIPIIEKDYDPELKFTVPVSYPFYLESTNQKGVIGSIVEQSDNSIRNYPFSRYCSNIPNRYCLSQPLQLSTTNCLNIELYEAKLFFSTTNSFELQMFKLQIESQLNQLLFQRHQLLLDIYVASDSIQTLSVSSHKVDYIRGNTSTVEIRLSGITKYPVSRYASKSIFDRLADAWIFVYMLTFIFICQEIKRIATDTSNPNPSQNHPPTHPPTKYNSHKYELLQMGDLLNFIHTTKYNCSRSKYL